MMSAIQTLALSYYPLYGMIISGIIGLISLVIKNSKVAHILQMSCYFTIILCCAFIFILSIILNIMTILGY